MSINREKTFDYWLHVNKTFYTVMQTLAGLDLYAFIVKHGNMLGDRKGMWRGIRLVSE